MLAVAADGSVRDALSLLDQAIAFGDGELREADIGLIAGNMLGAIEPTMGRRYRRSAGSMAKTAARLIDDRPRVWRIAAPDYQHRDLERIVVVDLSRVAIFQVASAGPDPVDQDQGDSVKTLAGRTHLTPEGVPTLLPDRIDGSPGSCLWPPTPKPVSK